MRIDDDVMLGHDLATALDRHIERFGLKKSSSFVTNNLIERAGK